MEKKKLIKNKSLRKFFLFSLFLIIVYLVQFLGSFAVNRSSEVWYSMLKRPSWGPPNYIFAPIWIILYIVVATVGFLLWTAPKSKKRIFCILFWILQLFFNAGWTYFFFNLKSPMLGLIDIVLVIGFSILVVIYAYGIRKSVSFLLIPYILWLIYAASLNFSIILMN